MERITAVVLDDEKHIVNLIKVLVPWDSVGIELAGEAYNGIDGFSLIEKVHPDIVITDIMMPGKGGLDLIRDVHSRFPDTEFVIISGYREFDYAQTAIRSGVENYLLKPIDKEELVASLTKLRSSILTKRDVLKRLKESEEERRIRELSTFIHKDEGPLNRSIILIKIDSTSLYLSQEEYRVIHDKTRSLVMKTGYADALYAENDIITILLSEDIPAMEAADNINYSLNELRTLFSRFFFSFFLAIKEEGKTIFSLYQDLKEMLILRFTEKGIIQRRPFISGKIDDKVMDAWASNVDRMLDSLDNSVIAEALDSFEKNVDKEFALFKSLEKAGWILGLKALNRVAGGDSWYREKLMPSLSIAPDVESLLMRFRLICMSFLIGIAKEKRTAESRPIREAIRYIDSHFSDSDFSLETVSSVVGLSASYFSQLFRKETGKGFQEFLLDVRVQKAKELLRDTKKTIYTVAQSVGYSDAKHFSKIFYKKTGVKPNEFRRLYG